MKGFSKGFLRVVWKTFRVLKRGDERRMRNEHVTKDRGLGRAALHKHSSFIGRFQDEGVR